MNAPISTDEGSSNNLSHDDYRISLYYCYVEIKNVSFHVSFQKELCEDLSLHGRIRVSQEGLNGVLSGRHSKLLEYQHRVEAAFPLEERIDVKYCQLRKDLPVDSQLFGSFSVKATREVLSLYEPTPQEVQPNQQIEGHKYQRRRRRNRQKGELQQQQGQASDPSATDVVPKSSLASFNPAPHLTPQEWNERLSSDPNAILVDARNVYESRVGYFQLDGVPTLLTNTRQYSSLPQVLQNSKKEFAGKNVYMYCTGGVRCERASVFLQAMIATTDRDDESKEPRKEIFQLEGGIQRYLEHYGGASNGSAVAAAADPDCLFRGRNFVFDPRRTDPVVGRGLVGSCLFCGNPHDDYDNGKAPSEHREARCCKCRVLVLVCDSCRSSVRTWGEKTTTTSGDDDDEVVENPNVYCGGDHCVEGNCIQATMAK